MRARSGSSPSTQNSRNVLLTSASSGDRVQQVADHHRLEHVELEVARASPPMLTAVSLPITWHATIVIASDWVGFTLPGMIELPGSFSGRIELAEPARGPGAQPADVVGDLHEARRERGERAAGEHDGVVRGQRRELVRRRRRTAAR